MTSQSPSDNPEKIFLPRTIRQWFRGTPKPSTSRSPSQHSGQMVSTPGSASRFLPQSQSTSPASISGILPSELEEREPEIRPPSAPPTEPRTPDASIVAAGSRLERGNVARSRLSASLVSLLAAATAFPPLHSAVSSFIGCLDIAQIAATNLQDYELLAKELYVLADMLNQHSSMLDSETNNGSITNISRCIERQVADIMQKMERKNVGRLLGAVEDQADVVMRYKQIERLFRQLQCDISLRATNEVKEQREETLLRGICPIDDARYNSSYSTTIKRHGCTTETRKDIQQALQEWAIDPIGTKIYWLDGMAGIGKTTIAYSFCQWLENTNRLGASFFCSRISSECRSLNRIVPTLAYQLARYSLAFRSTLCATLKDNPDAGTLNVFEQFEKLIYWPMSKAKDAIPDSVVLVIDALDECDDIRSVSLLLDVLFRFATNLPVKFLVASRPEYAIRSGMLSRGQADRSILHLHSVEKSLVQEDIKKYLAEALGSMPSPPSHEDNELLAKHAGNLFIYATQIVEHIRPRDEHLDPSARLQEILRGLVVHNWDADYHYTGLDHLYDTVLETAFAQRLEPKEYDYMRRVIWTVVQIRGPMTVGEVASLGMLTEHQVLFALRSLRSVLHVSQNDVLVSVPHASFRGYILDQTRSKRFYFDGSQFGEAIARRRLSLHSGNPRMTIPSTQEDSDSDHDAPTDIAIEAEDKPSESATTEWISCHMTLREMFDCLLRHGCADLSERMDTQQDTATLMSGGGFGDIWIAKMHDETQVAIKTWRSNIIEKYDYKTLKRATREIYYWSTMKHENIHQLIGVIMFKSNFIGMVSPWMENGNLHEYIRRNPEINRYQLCIEVALGLAYMHSHDLVHGDLKASNVLVSSDGVAKLSDFDYAVMTRAGNIAFSETSNMRGGSTRWAAPEILREDDPRRSKQSDVYALGMTILEIITGEIPYPQCRTDFSVIRTVGNDILPTRPTSLTNDQHGNLVWDLLVRCWDRAPDTRPSADQVASSLQDQNPQD